jgi:hypothetical protein
MTPRARRLVAAVFTTAVVCLAGDAAAATRTVVHVPFKGPRQIEDFQRRGIEIVAFTRLGVDVLADEGQLDYLLSLSYPVSAEPPRDPSMVTGSAALDANLGLYHTFAEMETLITGWETTYPAILDVFTLSPFTIEGRTIYALKISDNVTVDESEPEVLYMGNLHARELMAVEMPLLFAEYLLENYGVDAAVTGYVDTREIFFVPMINVDGHIHVENNHAGESFTWWRLNRRLNANLTYGVDLNRNFGYEWGYDNIGSVATPGAQTYRGTAPFSEPETQAIRDFADTRNFTMWLSYHSYGELLLYPWGYIYADTPEHEVYAALGDSLSAANGYLAGNPASGAIYITNGDSDDWGYGEQATKDKIFAFTPEVNNYDQGGFGPEDTYIQPTFDLNLEMNLLLLKYAANPYQVVGPYRPAQYAVSEPWANAVHRLSWTASDPADPNPIDHYEIESCESPSWVADAGLSLSLWNNAGFSSASGHTGAGYASGSGNNLNRSLTMIQPYVVDASSDTLSFWITYDIEPDYDYGYVEVSTDGGGSWTTVEGNVTTTYDPHGWNLGHGITGQSGGWVFASFPLTAYTGQEVLVRIRYVTDGGLVEPGMTVDDLFPVASCAGVSSTATANADTTLDVTPIAVATYRYRVRGVDGEGHVSLWSDAEDYAVATLTAAGEPLRFHTRLGANYPNPFNPETRIPYVVGGPATGGGAERVTLRVYAVTGALVATLVSGERPPGAHEARWEGTNDAGQAMASGIYFARLVVGNDAPATRKLVILK